ncbi:MAG: carotenoid oxygenase family protein [Acidimicrobiales bacterium]
MALRPSPNRYLSGNNAPMLEEHTLTELEVQGQIPPELDGRFIRNGPNPLDDPDPATYHWFTGNGMVHGVRFREGRAEWYRNRIVRGAAASEWLGEEPVSGPHSDIFRGGANTNVIGHAGATWAIVEAGGLPARLSDTLDTEAIDGFGGTLEGPFSAHPKRDPATGELHAVCYSPMIGDSVHVVTVGTDGRVRKTVSVPTPAIPMLHDCAITETYVVVMDLPCLFSLEDAMAGKAPFGWSEDYTARFGLLPMEATSADEIRWFEIDPCYIFHVLNAHDLPDGGVVIDAVRHPKMFAKSKLGPNEGAPNLSRWTIDTTSGKVAEEVLDERPQEFPRHDERNEGRVHRFGYSASNLGVDDDKSADALKIDLVAGRTEMHNYGRGRATLEPVFIPRSPEAGEDDGFVMSYVYDATTDTSDVVILAAQDFAGDPLATIKLPVRVPFGFHGNWVPTG